MNNLLLFATMLNTNFYILLFYIFFSIEGNPICRRFCEEFTNELLRRESVLNTLREIDNKVGKNSHNCFRDWVDVLYTCFKITLSGSKKQEEFEENLRKVIKIYKKINAEIGKVQKTDEALEYLEPAKRAIEFFVTSGKEDEKWKNIPREMKEEILQILVPGGFFFRILELISLSSEYLEILRKYENEVRKKIRETIEKGEYSYIQTFVRYWMELYEMLGLDLRELYEEVKRRILNDVEKHEKWRLKEPRHPYEEVVEEARIKISDEFGEFIKRSRKLDANYYFAIKLINNFFLTRVLYDRSVLDNFPDDVKIEIFEELVKLLANHGDIDLLTTLQKELSEVEDGEEYKQYQSILKKYLPLAAERFVDLLERGYNILDEAPIFLSLMDSIPENLRERGLRAYLKREYVGNYLLDLAQNSKIPIDIRAEAVKKAVEYYVKIKDFEKVVDIYYNNKIPDEAKKYVEKKIRDLSNVIVAYLLELGKYKKIRALIDDNLLKEEVMKTVNQNRKYLAERCMDRLLDRFFGKEIFSSTYEENLKAIIEDSQLPPETRERAKHLLRYLERK